MRIEIYPDANTVAQQAATHLAALIREAAMQGRAFSLAISGGSTPWQMLRLLAGQELPWEVLRIVQVDERVAPADAAERNLTHLRATLVDQTPLHSEQVFAMPVEMPDLDAAASSYAQTLRQVAGDPPVLDLVHLGLGTDGHTASLIPDDPVLEVQDRDVAITSGEYQGRRRMTLTYPILNRAREILWLITGANKAAMLARLLQGDVSIPAGRIRSDSSMILTDAAAAGQ